MKKSNCKPIRLIKKIGGPYYPDITVWAVVLFLDREWVYPPNIKNKDAVMILKAWNCDTTLESGEKYINRCISHNSKESV